MLTEARQEGGSIEIHPSELMTPCIYDEKFSTGTQFLFGMLLFVAGEDGDLEHPTQEQEKWRTAMIDFEFSQGLKHDATVL
jgi:hypothetical protein